MTKAATRTPEEVWDPWNEDIVDSWDSALETISKIVKLCGPKLLCWRGVPNRKWALHSSLARRIFDLTKIAPGEDVLTRYEIEILDRCRTDWRFDHRSALELLANIQHFGGPTRLIDVTLNPLVALWFAVEEKVDRCGHEEHPGVDARVFAVTIPDRISLDENWGTRGLPWDPQPVNWGTYKDRIRFWVPPAYNARISAQNAGFIFGGTPNSYGISAWRDKPGASSVALHLEDVLAASSLFAVPASMKQKAAQGTSRVYNFRISHLAKTHIRSVLHRVYGISASSIYPDWSGVSQNILKKPIM